MNANKQNKRFLSFILALVLAATMIFTPAVVWADHSHNGQVFTDSYTWEPGTITSGTNYHLATDTAITYSGHLFITVNPFTLCLYGKILTINDTGSNTGFVIGLPAGNSVFNLYDDGGGQIRLSDSYAGSIIEIQEGTFNMYGGTLVGNGSISDGVRVLSGTAFNMYGGTITNNDYGVYLVSGAGFNMYGGTVTGNSNGGVYVNGGTFSVSGSTVVSGNTFNAKPQNVVLKNVDNDVINISGPLTAGASIGVTLLDGVDPTTGVITSGWTTYMGSADPAAYFTADTAGYYITLAAVGATTEVAIQAGLATAPTVSAITGAELTYGYTSGNIGVTAETPVGHTLSYKWNLCSSTGAIKSLEGSTTVPTYSIPTDKPVGTYYYKCEVTATRTDNSMSASTMSSVTTVIVSPKAITVAANNKSKTYGSADPELTYTPTGLVGTDTLSGSLSRDPGENVGDYSITQGTLINPNYSIAFTQGTLTITPKAITIAALDQTVSTGAGIAHGTEQISSAGILPGHSITDITLTSSPTDVATTNGSITPSAATIKVGETNVTSNYAITYLSGKLVVKGSPSYTAPAAKDLTYNGSVQELANAGSTSDGTIKYSTSQYGDYGLTIPKATDAGTYEIWWKLDGDECHESIDATRVAITIKQKTVTVSGLSVDDKLYDGTTAAVLNVSAASFEGKLGVDDLSVTGNALFVNKNVGVDKTVNITSLTLQGTKAGNYTLSNTTTTAAASITAKAITVTANAVNKTYGDNDPDLTFTSDPLFAGDSFSGSLVREAGTNVSTYAIGQGSLTAGDNYSITFIPAIFTINPKALTITADNKVKTYHDEDPVLTATLTGLVPGDEGTIAYSLSREGDETATTHAINVNVTPATITNYTVTTISGILTIDPKPLTITVGSVTITYGDAEPDLIGYMTSSSIFTNDDGIDVSVTRAPGVNASTYAIYLNVTQGAIPNFIVTTSVGIFSITPKAINVYADPKTKQVGTSDPALTYTSDGGLLAGDNFTGSLTRATGEAVGVYAITQGSLSAGGDYIINFTDSTLTITAAPPAGGGGSSDDDLLIRDLHIAYMGGYADGTIKPQNRVTRAEVAMIFYRLLRNQKVHINVSFPDVEKGKWYETAVNTLASLQIINGDTKGNFRPNDLITRAEFAAIATRFGTQVKKDIKFTDIASSHWAYNNIRTAYANGWINGYPDGSFGPDKPVTRAEVMAVVNRLLKRQADKEYIDVHHDMIKQFTDLGKDAWYYYDVIEASNEHQFTRSGGTEHWK